MKVWEQAWRTFWPKFKAKMDLGDKTYGDASFSRHPLEIVEEMQQECIDLAGWGLILHERLQVLKQALLEVDEDTTRISIDDAQQAHKTARMWRR